MSHRFLWASVVLLAWVNTLPAQGVQGFLGKSAAQWQKELNTGDAKTRRNAAFALGKMGNDGAAYIPDLKKALTYSDPKVKEAAAFALADLAKDNPRLGSDHDVIPALTTALRDGDPFVRRSAAYALGCLGTDAVKTAPQLQKLLASEADAGVRQNAAWALGKMGDAGLEGVKLALKDSDPMVKRDAAASLVSQKPETVRKVLPELAENCKVNNTEVRRAAINALIKVVGPDDQAYAGGLRTALTDPDVEVKTNAALALGNIGGENAKAAVGVLVAGLQGTNLEVRRQSAAALGNVGEAAASAVPALIKALSDADPDTRANAALALGGIGGPAERAYEQLLKLLENPSEREKTRFQAINALKGIDASLLEKTKSVSASSEPAVPRLLRQMENPSNPPKLRERVIWALRVHGGNLLNLNVFSSFYKVLNEPKTKDNRMLRYDCAYMLGMLEGPAAQPAALNTLSEFLKDDTVQIFRGTTTSTGGAGTEIKGGTTQSKDVGYSDGRKMAVQALYRITVDADKSPNPAGVAKVKGNAEIMTQLRVLSTQPRLDPEFQEMVKNFLSTLN